MFYGELLVEKHFEVEVQLCIIHQGSLKYPFFLVGNPNNTHIYGTFEDSLIAMQCLGCFLMIPVHHIDSLPFDSKLPQLSALSEIFRNKPKLGAFKSFSPS